MLTVNCPTLQDYIAGDQCQENLAGVASTVYAFNKADLQNKLTANENLYSTPSFKSGKGLYKIDCKEEANSIQGTSLGPNKGFRLTLAFTLDAVNKIASKIGRAVNNLDLGFIVVDGEDSQILYDPNRRVKFEADGIQSNTGAAAADDRTTVFNAQLGPVNYPNLYVSAPEEGGWDSLLASAADSSHDGDDSSHDSDDSSLDAG